MTHGGDLLLLAHTGKSRCGPRGLRVLGFWYRLKCWAAGGTPAAVDFFSCFFSKDREDVYFMKGAFEEVICHCSMYNNGGIPLPLTPQQKSYCQQEEKMMGSLGLRGWYHVSLPYPLGL